LEAKFLSVSRSKLNMNKDSIGVNKKNDESMDNVRRITLGKEDKKRFGSWIKLMIFFMEGIV